MSSFPPTSSPRRSLLWLAACLAWAFGPGGPWRSFPIVAGVLAFGGHFVLAPAFGLKTLAVNDYKGVSYARKFPDAKRVYESASPFGYLEVYSSSYLHFAPGLSDNAGFTLPTMPVNAYLGMYIDSDGPIGIMRDLADKETAYFRFLPMVYPTSSSRRRRPSSPSSAGASRPRSRCIPAPRTSPSPKATRPCSHAFTSPAIRDFTGDILSKVARH